MKPAILTVVLTGAALILVSSVISGCSALSLQRVQAHFDRSTSSQSVGVESTEPISDYWLRKYNIAAQSELSRVWRFGRQVGWKNRYRRVLRAVLKYDERHADYFATEVSEEVERMGRSVEFGKLTSLFRRHGVIINWRYSDSQNGDFLWKLGELYELPNDIQQVLTSLYPSDKFEIPVLETVTTDNFSANQQIADFAFLAPAAITRSSEKIGWDADTVTKAVAAHEAAHHVNEQIITAMGYTREPYYRTHLATISDAVKLIDFYHEFEVEEFLADAVAIQLSGNSTMPAQIVGLVASRLLQAADPFKLVKHKDRQIRRRPHFASAEFIYKLFKEEEARRGYGDNFRNSITKLRSEGKTGTQWRREKWLPYLDKMLTDDFMHTIRRAYRQAFTDILAVLRM